MAFFLMLPREDITSQFSYLTNFLSAFEHMVFRLTSVNFRYLLVLEVNFIAIINRQRDIWMHNVARVQTLHHLANWWPLMFLRQLNILMYDAYCFDLSAFRDFSHWSVCKRDHVILNCSLDLRKIATCLLSQLLAICHFRIFIPSLSISYLPKSETFWLTWRIENETQNLCCIFAAHQRAP